MNNKYLKSIYYDVKKSPASYTGKKNLYDQIRTHGKNKQINKSDLANWLDQQRTYTLHKPRKVRFPRSKIKTYHIRELYQSDLAEVWKIAKFNRGVRYLLFVIDTFSRYLWVEPLLRKDAESVTHGFSKILAKAFSPKMLHTDNDSAFKSRLFQEEIVKKHGIHFYTSKDDAIKAAFVERVIRTIKLRIAKYMTSQNTNEYINVLQNIVHDYNRTKHSSIGMAPANVKPKHEKQIFKRMFPKLANKNLARKHRKFKRGDVVRIAKKSGKFSKEGTPKWSEELFRIDRLKEQVSPYRYTLKEWDNITPIDGSWYEDELQKVKVSEFIIEKVLRHRTLKDGTKQVLIKWFGYPEKYTSWENELSVRDIRGKVF